MADISNIIINSNNYTIKDVESREAIETIVSAISNNNSSIGSRINDLNDRSFDGLIKVDSDSIYDSISNPGLYKVQQGSYDTSGVQAEEDPEFIVTSNRILYNSSSKQVEYWDNQFRYRNKTNNTWESWITIDLSNTLSNNYATSTDTNEDLLLASGDTYEEAFGKLEKAYLDNELVVATSIDNLDDRIDTLGETIVSVQTVADSKYAKPSGGIPLSDLDPSIQQNISSGKEDTLLNSSYEGMIRKVDHVIEMYTPSDIKVEVCIDDKDNDAFYHVGNNSIMTVSAIQKWFQMKEEGKGLSEINVTETDKRSWNDRDLIDLAYKITYEVSSDADFPFDLFYDPFLMPDLYLNEKLYTGSSKSITKDQIMLYPRKEIDYVEDNYYGKHILKVPHYRGVAVIGFSGCTKIVSAEVDYNFLNFNGCTNLRDVKILENVTEITNNAFKNCSNLTKITAKPTIAPTLGTDCFSSISQTGTLYYPVGSDYSTWIAALPSGWKALPMYEDFAYHNAAIPYGEVDSTSTSTVYTATIPNITALEDGVCVLLKNGVVTSTTNFTININELGAKPVYSNMGTGNPTTPTAPTRESTIFNINYTMLFVYSSTLVSGGAWICYTGLPSITSSDNGKILIVSDGHWSLTSPITLYSGSGVPSNSQGNNGDIYVQTGVSYRQSTGNTVVLNDNEIVDCGTLTNPVLTINTTSASLEEYRFFFTCGLTNMQLSFTGNINLLWRDTPELISGVTYECSILKVSNKFYGVIINYE